MNPTSRSSIFLFDLTLFLAALAIAVLIAAALGSLLEGV